MALADKYNDESEQMWGFPPVELHEVAPVYAIEIFVYGLANCDLPDIRVKVAGTWTSTQTLSLPSSYGWTSIVFPGIWNVSEIDALEVGVKTQVMSGGDEVQIWALYCKVCGYELPPAPDPGPEEFQKGAVDPNVNSECRMCCEILSGLGAMGLNSRISALSIPPDLGYKNPGFIGLSGIGACRFCGSGPPHNWWPECLCGNVATQYWQTVGVYFVRKHSPIDMKFQALDWIDSIGGPSCLNYFHSVGAEIPCPMCHDEFLHSDPQRLGPISTSNRGSSWRFISGWNAYYHPLVIDGVVFQYFAPDTPIYPAYGVYTVFDIEVDVAEEVVSGGPGLRIKYDISGGPSTNTLDLMRRHINDHMDLNHSHPSLPSPNAQIPDPKPKKEHIIIRVESMDGLRHAEAHAEVDGYSGEILWDGAWAQPQQPRWNGLDIVRATVKGYLGTEVLYCNTKHIDDRPVPKWAYIADRIHEPHIEGPYTGPPEYSFQETIIHIAEYPAVEIMYNVFISPEVIDTGSIPIVTDYYEGDNRTFSYAFQDSSRGKMRVKASLHPSVQDGVLPNSFEASFGTTNGYDNENSNDIEECEHCFPSAHCLKSTASAECTQTAQNGTSGYELSITGNRISDEEIAIHAVLEGANPCESLSPAINAEFTITFRQIEDGGSAGPIEFKLLGEHDGFPWHELYINGELIYSHDPCLTEDTPNSLFPSIGDYEYQDKTYHGTSLSEFQVVPGL